MSPAGDWRMHALTSEGGDLCCPACGWRVQAIAPEIETDGLICPTCGELIYSGRELDDRPKRPPLAR